MNKENKNRRRGIVAFTTVIWGYGECISMTSGRKPWMQRKREREREREKSERGCNTRCSAIAEKPRCRVRYIVFARSRRLELGDNILRIL